MEASLRTQLVLTTHSAQFLDAFGNERPKTTIAKWTNGETKLVVLEGERLESWLHA